MLIKDFQSLMDLALARGRVTIAIAAAQDLEVIEAVRDASRLGLARAILVGDQAGIERIADTWGLPADARIVHCASSAEAAREAVRLVKSGEADILMKGAINTSDFLKAVVDRDLGLRTERLLSHLAAFEVPGEPRLLFQSDGGMNVAPDAEQLGQILANAVDALHALGIEEPKVAVLAANEQVNPKASATVNAAALVELWRAGAFPSCVVEGPIALDVATSSEAARVKGIASAIAGEAELFIVPSIESGNIMGKALVRYAKAKMAGIVLGARCPIVLVSRGDDSSAKLRSLALASVAARGARP